MTDRLTLADLEPEDGAFTAEAEARLRASRPSVYVDYLIERGWAWSDALNKALATIDALRSTTGTADIDVERLARALDAADDAMLDRGYTLASFANETYAPVVAAEYARLATPPEPVDVDGESIFGGER